MPPIRCSSPAARAAPAVGSASTCRSWRVPPSPLASRPCSSRPTSSLIARRATVPTWCRWRGWKSYSLTCSASTRWRRPKGPWRSEHGQASGSSGMFQLRRSLVITTGAGAIRGPPSTGEVSNDAPVPRAINLVVNGRAVAVEVEPRVTLLDFLRDRLGLTGTKKGCNEGARGTCTVLVDGKRMNGCLTLVVQCEGRQVTTIEGIASDEGELYPVAGRVHPSRRVPVRLLHAR